MTASVALVREDARLPAWSLFAGMLAAAGLPIYIHAPKFFVDNYGVGLGALGGVLFALRLLDLVQDPLLGRLAQRSRRYRGSTASLACALLACAMIGLFAVEPVGSPLIWFAAMLALLFSCYSYLTILFYAQGVTRADALGPGGHLRLARWRETGALLGVCLAAVVPTLAMGASDQPFTLFAVGFAILAILAAIVMQPEWQAPAGVQTRASLMADLRLVMDDPIARRLLVVALVNAAPVAVSSTLFLFFVESRLLAPAAAGPLLLLFFLSAAMAAPLWGRLADRTGARSTLLGGMALSVLAFGGAVALGAGDVLPFAVICIASGAALGADMTLLPAMFSARMAQLVPDAGQAFGLWSFATKFSLAFAAAILLPLLDQAGFESGQQNSEAALVRLSLLYAAVPCALKVLAMALLYSLKHEDT